MALHEKLENTEYDIEIVAVGAGDVVSIVGRDDISALRRESNDALFRAEVLVIECSFDTGTSTSRTHHRGTEITRDLFSFSSRDRLPLALPEPFQRL